MDGNWQLAGCGRFHKLWIRLNDFEDMLQQPVFSTCKLSSEHHQEQMEALKGWVQAYLCTRRSWQKQLWWTFKYLWWQEYDHVTSVPTNGSHWPIYSLCASFAESGCFQAFVSPGWRRRHCSSLPDACLPFRLLKVVFLFPQLTRIGWNKYTDLCFCTAMSQLSGAGKEEWRKVWESECEGFVFWHLRPWTQRLGKGAEQTKE